MRKREKNPMYYILNKKFSSKILFLDILSEIAQVLQVFHIFILLYTHSLYAVGYNYDVMWGITIPDVGYYYDVMGYFYR